ncbi:hypothetical protein K504DRAFT_427611 [Pleomassaria siparia CBS 279.74]|uniref:LPS export ABC transporter periplasmic protein LptC n=1 Tax=Pleomassaria siparia CBS 279.74 TaxID=1314801 RepID=A0A6G1KER8_9PLEO|nr:hypothetical protein K504DRAFT_427611 [Pleomassaria siparia CBS 279.74]
MSTSIKSPIVFLCIFLFSSILLFRGSSHTKSMHSLTESFTIEVNGSPIAKVAEDAEDSTQAKTGSDGAVFTLKDGQLQSGNWLLARNLTEDRSFMPKPVQWFKSGEDTAQRIKPVSASKVGDGYQLRFDNARLIQREGNILADLRVDEGEEQATVKLQT